ncbi:MAG: branched-chain amino acid ABC transporter permease [Armatimonadota bacterium]|nr:branched-chain amino acid ABC transporter permease [Armatimonadota bacterium]MDR7444533.1 branched-chain amino acid ABC transporter permease [Armatimonadota bacterium]MDR7570671.1 branched-chain amino acid ABC transporter permease [Armatimonadota bacterium]MDR7615324.1 branched-chain amino acid ABC transporter permease [Armatimonadota bacterium]
MKRAGAVVAGVGLLVLPLVVREAAVVNWTFLVLLSVALAQSWNLVGGFGGQVNLGLAAFFGIGALLTRFLWLGGVPVVAALAAGCAGSVLAGLLVGAPSLRLRGPYFAIGTLAMAEILRIVVGTTLPEVSALPSRAIATYRLLPRYYLVLLVAAAVTLAAWWLSRARFGLGLVAVREDELVAESVGVDAFRHKLLAFLLSAGFAGAAGGAFGYYHPSFYPQFAFSPVWTFDSMLMVFLGGIGTVWGPVVGAAFFVTVREILALGLAEVHVLVFGLLFILVVLLLPGGLVEIGRSLRRFVPARTAPKRRPADLVRGI